MGIMTWITGGSLAAVALVYALWTYDSRTHEAELATADALVSIAQKQVETAKATVEGNKAVVEKLKQQVADQTKIATEYQALANKRAAKLGQMQKVITNAPDNAPVSDPIECVIDSLRGLGPCGAATDGADEAPAGDVAAPDRPVVQPRPKPAP